MQGRSKKARHEDLAHVFLVTFAFGDRCKVKRYQARTEQLLGVVWVIL